MAVNKDRPIRCSGRFGLDAHESGHLLCDMV